MNQQENFLGFVNQKLQELEHRLDVLETHVLRILREIEQPTEDPQEKLKQYTG